MRKITIPVSAVLALSAIQMAQAATFTVDFSKVTEEQRAQLRTTGAIVDGFTFMGRPTSDGDDTSALNWNASSKTGSFTLSGRSLSGKRYISISPKKDGTLTYQVTARKDGVHTAVTTESIDYNNIANRQEIVIQETPELAKNAAGTYSVNLVAGKTYYILVNNQVQFYHLSYSEATPSRDVDLTIKKDNTSASTEITLKAAGTYTFSAPDGVTLSVSESKAKAISEETFVATKNDTKVTITATVAEKAKADTKYAITYTISDASLNEVKSVYTQKIAVMINKANVYTNDARLQECAVKASSLMAKANNMSLEQYEEYKTTGKVAGLETEIANLTAQIDNAKASYDGYAYAQEKYGNKYDNGWVLDESNTTSLLAKKAELDEAYKSAQKNVKEEAALTALKAVYDNAVAALTDFKSTIDAEYEAGKQTDLNAYKTYIDGLVGKVKEGETAGTGVMGTLDDAKNAIVNGDGNAISYANVNTRVNNAKARYDEEANKLYILLANNAIEKDGDTYRDMYVESLSKLNDYLRVINEVKAANEAKYKAEECTKETQAAFDEQLAVICNIGTVYAEYEEKATTLRANYKEACNYVKNNLTGYLAEQVKNVIGKKNGKDYKREEVSAFYAEQVAAIEKSIAAIQTNVDDVNKKHTIGDGAAAPYYADYEKDKAAVLKVIDELAPKVEKSVREFDNWESSKTTVADLQADFNLKKDGNGKDVTGIKNTVSKDKVYDQKTKFAAEYERTIQERLNALLAAANASFKADGTGTAEEFYNGIANNQEKDGKVTLYGSTAIAANIAGYATAADGAMTKYETVVEALASYDEALNGKAAVGEEGKDGYVQAVTGLKEVAVNRDVTIDGTFEGKTYGEYIAEVEKKIGATEGLKKQLDDAVAKNDTAHVEAMAALATFDDLVAEIANLQEKYAGNEKQWNDVQLAHAKQSMLAEAERRVGEIDTKNVIKNEVYKDEYNTEVDPENKSENTTSYEKDTYGKWVYDQIVKEGDTDKKIDGLATLLKNCNDAVAAINTKISNAKASTDDAAAIAILSEVVDDLIKAEEKYTTLSTKAESVKKAYTAEKVARKELLVAINGKDGIIDELAKVMFEKNGANMFATETANQQTAITKLNGDIEAKFTEETVVANKADLTKAKNAIVTAVANLNDLVAKEKANKKADDDYDKTDTDINVNKAVIDAEAAIAKAVTDKKVVQDSDAYTYFVNTVLAGYRTEYANIGTARTTANTAVRKVYESDGKTILSGALDEAKYTDPAKNMTAVGGGLATQLATLKANIGKVAENLIACEAEYKSQTDKAAALDKLRKEVFDIITGAETSSYHEAALAELLVIDKDIADYKDSVTVAYRKGTNSTGKADIEAMANSAETKLNTLKTGWNDEYTKAVAADNQVRKQAFDDAYTALTKTYADDVDVIARLSKLSYADSFGEELKEVVGPDGIYSYADKIRDLKTRTEEAYSTTAAPALFDGGEKFKAEAETLKAEIDNITTDYTTLVNEAAKVTYTEKAAEVEKALTDAKTEVAAKLGADFATADFLTAGFKDVQDIIDEAKGHEKDADFAEYLDKEILPAFKTVDGKIAEDKINAAKKSYSDRLAAYRTLANSEATLIAGYNGEDGTLGAFSGEYKTFVENSIDKAEALWAEIADADKYAKFNQVADDETKSVKTALDAFGIPAEHAGYDKENKEQPAAWAEKHTATYWKAYDADQKYHANDISYAAMETAVEGVQAELDKAEEFVASLIIRNNTTVTNRLDIAQTAIDNLATEAEGYHKANTAEANLADFKEKCNKQIETIKTIIEGTASGDALVEENTAVEVQIGFLQHDYNQAAAVLIDDPDFTSKSEAYKNTIAGYSKKNKEILRDFREGKVDEKGAPIYVDGKPVYATAEETRQAFLALETEVGQMKSELTAIYNEKAAAAAQEAVQKKIDELTATYDAFVAQLADCHAPVKETYQPQVDAFKADIDALQAVLDAEVAANTVLLYQDENATTAGKIAESVSKLSADIAGMETPYDVNDAKYLEIRGQLNTLTERLESVYNAIQEYEHQWTGNYDCDINGDGEIGENEKFSAYAAKYYALYSYQIAKDMEWLNGENEKYNLTATSTPTEYTIDDIKSGINSMENDCAKYNAIMTISNINTALQFAKKDINSLGYTDADREALNTTYNTVNGNYGNLDNYNGNAYQGFVNKDINGKPIINEDETVGKAVVYMEEYPAIMAKAKEVADAVAALAQDAKDKSWIKGDVDHNGKITVGDYDAVRQIILEINNPAETSAMFYAADVNWDGLVNVGDLTLIGKYIMEGEKFPAAPAGTSSVAMAKGMALGLPTYGSLAMTAEGSGLTQTLKVAVDSPLGFVGGQFDVVLPAGVKLASVASSSHDALMGEVNGAVRVLVSNLENTEIVNGQTFVELNVEVTSDYNGGGIEVQNAKFADAEGTVFTLAKSSIGTPTGLTNLTTVEKVQSKVYSVGGMLMNKMKKGINIIVNSDGTTKKQVIE